MIRPIALLSFLMLLACGSDGGGSGSDIDGGADSADAAEMADAGPKDNNGEVPAPTPQSGVAYAAHWHTAADGEDKLMWYRYDGAEPTLAGTLDLGGPTQGMALDPVGDLLGFVSDVDKSVALYRVHRPATKDDPVPEPTFLDKLFYTDVGVPVAVFFNSQLKRLYTVVAEPDQMSEFSLFAYDVSTPDDVDGDNWLRPITGFPTLVPSNVYYSVDGARNLMFVAAYHASDSNYYLHAFDLDDSGLRPLDGEPLDLETLFPVPDGETTNAGFQARHTTVDPWRNRVYISRSQTVHSELMVFEYPPGVPRNGARYGDFEDMSSLALVPDAFDLSSPFNERPNLLGAYGIDFDVATGQVFMAGDAWNGTSATAIIASFEPGLNALAKGCNDFEGFGCFIRSYFEGNPSSYVRTDGAICTDSTRKIVVATSVAQPEVDPGRVHFYSYEDSGYTMDTIVPASGGNTMASSLPVEVVCH